MAAVASCVACQSLFSLQCKGAALLRVQADFYGQSSFLFVFNLLPLKSWD